MNLVNIIIIFGIAQGFFFGIALISIKRGNRSANRIMGVLLILFAYSITPMIFIKTGFYFSYPMFFKSAQPLLFLFGPLFLLYTKILTDRSYRFKWTRLWHLIPFLCFLIYLIPIYALPGEEKVKLIQNTIGGSFKFERIVTPIQIIHLFVYMFIVDRVVTRHTQNLKRSFSSIEKINLSWLRNGVWGFGIVFSIMAALILVQLFLYPVIANYGGEIIAFLVTFVICYIGYKGLQQPEIFTGSEDSEPAARYEKSTLDSAKAQQYKKRLVNFMTTDKPFLDSLLTIKVLGQKLGIPSYHLSQIINESFRQNFFDFINGYRIEEAKRQLHNPKFDHISIQGIAFDVGFNSKSAFNNAFKKYTKMTPSEFRVLK